MALPSSLIYGNFSLISEISTSFWAINLKKFTELSAFFNNSIAFSLSAICSEMIDSASKSIKWALANDSHVSFPVNEFLVFSHKCGTYCFRKPISEPSVSKS